jgi:hypothetical protein
MGARPRRRPMLSRTLRGMAEAWGGRFAGPPLNPTRCPMPIARYDRSLRFSSRSDATRVRQRPHRPNGW